MLYLFLFFLVMNFFDFFTDFGFVHILGGKV